MKLDGFLPTSPLAFTEPKSGIEKVTVLVIRKMA